MHQRLAQAEYATKRKVTRRDHFLAEVEQIVPWAALIAALKPYYFPDAGTGPGRHPIGLQRMLHMYCLQQWYAPLADEVLEDAIYDSQMLRNFVGVDLSHESVPDATTLLGFRHLLEEHGLTKTLFETVNSHRREHGLLLNKGTLIDATILAAPSSTKNKKKARDPQMHQTRKGKQWYFGMKAHIGADADSGLVHTLVGTAANVSDVSQSEHLLHGEEQMVFADIGHVGAHKRKTLKDKLLKWHIAMKRGKLKAMAEGPIEKLTRRAEQLKAQPHASSIRFMSSRTCLVTAKSPTKASLRTCRLHTSRQPFEYTDVCKTSGFQQSSINSNGQR